MLTKRSLAMYSLLCSLFLTASASARIVAFSLQPSSSTSASIQTVQQGVPSLGIPGQEQQDQPQQQPQATPQPPSPPISSSAPTNIPQQQQEAPATTTTEGIVARGIIDSLIFTPSSTWIATGNWTIGVNNGVAALVTANMTWYNDNGTASHTHEILNFKPTEAIGGQQEPILVQPADNSVSLRGVVDVGANHRIAWNDVQSTIDIKKGGKILSISLNDAQTNNHFGARPIFGIVTSFTRCSDVPGPQMEMPTPCLNIPATPPQPTVAAPTPQPSTTNAPTVSPPAIAANNTVQSPSNLTANSPPASFSSPSGNTTISRHPPAVSNATGKSSFDILGGG